MQYEKIADAQIENDIYNYLKKVGTKIKCKREELNLSQVDLAFITNMSHSTIFYIEAGLNNATMKSLFKISLVLKIDIKELLS